MIKNMMMKKLNKFLEIFWLVVSIITILIVVYVYAKIGIKDNLVLLLLPVISVGMFVFRRSLREKFEKKNG